MSAHTLATAPNANSSHGCPICLTKNQQILAKDEVIRAKDAVIAAKDDAITQKDLALKTERELREQLQRQLKMATIGVSKKSSLANLKSSSSQAQEERDALTIYIRNVTESISYDMLYEAFSAFGTIRTLNMVHPKACAFVEFTSPNAHQKALAAVSVPVGDGKESVLTEKRVRRQQQSPAFTRRPSANNLKASAAANNGNHHYSYNNSNIPTDYTPHTVSTAAAPVNVEATARNAVNSSNGIPAHALARHST
ncbi:hypothetical protein BGZ99_002083 [Dissophora globulifera]|uniref:RRM domain-containing protein n=1 Tax=Dissophora globulifera TaxID=979702 RepID=A0A9P6UXQ6_9FUNG|nr:hypothetical protein BGZ99_002083 [Dissophora globulifera]